MQLPRALFATGCARNRLVNAALWSPPEETRRVSESAGTGAADPVS